MDANLKLPFFLYLLLRAFPEGSFKIPPENKTVHDFIKQWENFFFKKLP